MYLTHKRTGEVVKFHYLQTDYISRLVFTFSQNEKIMMKKYDSLKQFTEEWEDYENE